MNSAKIDVIIPNYNRTISLDLAISSALIQGDLISKVIVIDDGSNNDVIEFIRKKVISRPKVHVIFSEHTGNPGLLRSIALVESTAEFVAFLDSDDFWFPGKFKIQLNEFKNKDVSLVCSNAIIYDKEIAVGRYFNEKYYELKTKTLLKRNLVINSTVVLRSKTLLLIDGYVSDFRFRGMEDYATWLRVSRIGQIRYINKCLIGFTRSPDSFGLQMGNSKMPTLISEFKKWNSNLSQLKIYNR